MPAIRIGTIVAPVDEHPAAGSEMRGTDPQVQIEHCPVTSKRSQDDSCLGSAQRRRPVRGDLELANAAGDHDGHVRVIQLCEALEGRTVEPIGVVDEHETGPVGLPGEGGRPSVDRRGGRRAGEAWKQQQRAPRRGDGVHLDIAVDIQGASSDVHQQVRLAGTAITEDERTARGAQHQHTALQRAGVESDRQSPAAVIVSGPGEHISERNHGRRARNTDRRMHVLGAVLALKHRTGEVGDRRDLDLHEIRCRDRPTWHRAWHQARLDAHRPIGAAIVEMQDDPLLEITHHACRGDVFVRGGHRAR